MRANSEEGERIRDLLRRYGANVSASGRRSEENEINNERLHNRNLIRTAGPYIAPD